MLTPKVTCDELRGGTKNLDALCLCYVELAPTVRVSCYGNPNRTTINITLDLKNKVVEQIFLSKLSGSKIVYNLKKDPEGTSNFELNSYGKLRPKNPNRTQSRILYVNRSMFVADENIHPPLTYVMRGDSRLNRTDNTQSQN